MVNKLLNLQCVLHYPLKLLHFISVDFLAIPPEAYFFFPFFYTWLIRPLQVGIWEKFSQFYFNWRWQHVVSDKKHIFFRDCNHQLGSYFLAPPSSWIYLEKETAACGLLNARELNLKKEREKVTQENNFKIHLESFCVCVFMCVRVCTRAKANINHLVQVLIYMQN